MLFRQLEYLVALARERHFAHAAQSCGVSQPSLSEAIRKLEEELEVPLIQRGRRFDGLTAEGERVVVWARQILADRDALQDEVAAMRTGLDGRIRIATVPSAATAVPRLVDPLCTRHPLLTAHVMADLTSREILTRLRDFSVDAALTYLDDEVRAAFQVVSLYQEKYVLLSDASWAPIGGETVSWAEAAALPLCLLTPAMRGRRTLDALFADVGAEPVARVETDSFAALIAHVVPGRWAGIVPLAFVHALGVPPGVRAVPMAEPSRAVEIGLVTCRREPESVTVRALVATARQVDLTPLERLPRMPSGFGAASGVRGDAATRPSAG
ncbi:MULTISPECIES: LysR family transcriptional regulator [unclassified Streptomyces]|uniref:LysR family transcriptional regulator n=1 Tax=unclassified Streptomyces TaxID=2593676 RepID=UPI003D8D11EC